MGADTASLFFALLAIVAQVAVVVGLVLWLGGMRSARLADAGISAREAVAPSALWLAWVVALTCTLGSLYLSEIAHCVPCKLCWYQRIAMYPLALLLPVAAWRGDRAAIRPYGLLLAGAGLAVSAWHNYVETFPERAGGGCDPTNPCTIRWVEGLGFWTIPRMAFVCFALVIAFLLIDRTPRPEVP